MQADKPENIVDKYRDDSIETLDTIDQLFTRQSVASNGGGSSLKQGQAVASAKSAQGTLNSDGLNNQFLNTLANVINHVNEAIFIINEDGVFEMLNPMAVKLFGASRESLLGQYWCDFLGNQCKDEYISLLLQWKKRQGRQRNHGPKEIVIHRADSLMLDVDLSLSYLPIEQTGHSPMYIGVMHNLTTHKAEYQALRRQARTDRLTGLANRHAFDDEMQSCWIDCINAQQPLGLVIIDVDYFKLFNDRYGHVNGDVCLKKIAAVIDKALPSRQCMAARYGGEEFALILPNCDAQAAELTAKRVQKAINQLTFTELGLHPSVRISVSQGIAVETLGQYRTPTALLCAADTALYRAKSDGRNRINVSV
jgi:diguanylate cyclase (GGDEF)-like protein/PAS domain S-box-containing protein